MKTSEPRFNAGPPEVGANWSEMNCEKFVFGEVITRTICRFRAEEHPGLGLVDCRECPDRQRPRK